MAGLLSCGRRSDKRQRMLEVFIKSAAGATVMLSSLWIGIYLRTDTPVRGAREFLEWLWERRRGSPSLVVFEAIASVGGALLVLYLFPPGLQL